MENVRVFGGKCIELLANYNHDMQCWKTYQISFDWGDDRWLDHLPPSGMIVNGQLYQLDNSTPLINGHDGSVLPNFPTPTPHELKQEPRYPSAWRREEVLNMNSCLGVKACRHYGITKKQAIGMELVINPAFIEWMMGFPIGWTELED